MTKTESRGEQRENFSLFNLTPAGFAALGGKHIADFANARSELFETLQESNRQWLDRWQSEMNLASEFTSKLSAMRSIPEVLGAYKEWSTRRFEMAAQDGKRLLADAQKFVETGVNLMTSAQFAKKGGNGAKPE